MCANVSSYGFPAVSIPFSFGFTTLFLWQCRGFPLLSLLIVPYGFPIVFLWLSYDLHTAFLLVSSRSPTVVQLFPIVSMWISSGFPMVFLWMSSGIPSAFLLHSLWLSFGCPTVFPSAVPLVFAKVFARYSIAFLCFFDCFPVVILWFSFGKPTFFLRCSHGFPLAFL